MHRRADLNILCWEGYADRGLLRPFADEFGVSVFGETFLSDFAAAARIASEEGAAWDIVNLNNPFARDYLRPKGLVRALDRARFEPFFERMLPAYRRIRRCAYSADGSELLGVCQRFGGFNLVINSDRISPAAAADQGFDLPNQPGNAKRFGILAYDDFNIFHISIGSGLDPFQPLSAAQIGVFAGTARRWFAAAAMVTADHHALNRALVTGDIDFYVSGGVYTCGAARLEGHRQLRAITPLRGPIAGKGGIVFVEVTSVVERPDTPAAAEDFLAYLMRPEVAIRIGCASGTLSPVMQMGDATVMRAFSARALDALQWDGLEEEVARSAEYAMVPSHSALHAALVAARGEAGWTLT